MACGDTRDLAIVAVRALALRVAADGCITVFGISMSNGNQSAPPRWGRRFRLPFPWPQSMVGI